MSFFFGFLPQNPPTTHTSRSSLNNTCSKSDQNCCCYGRSCCWSHCRRWCSSKRPQLRLLFHPFCIPVGTFSTRENLHQCCILLSGEILSLLVYLARFSAFRSNYDEPVCEVSVLIQLHLQGFFPGFVVQQQFAADDDDAPFILSSSVFFFCHVLFLKTRNCLAAEISKKLPNA